VLHLRWDDVEVEHRIITVRRGRNGTAKPGKMRRVRNVVELAVVR
jgi:hypothetical protein